MDLVSRAKNICMSPATEWAVIENEPATRGGLLSGYALPLAATWNVASFTGMTIIGLGVPFYRERIPFTPIFVAALYSLCTALVLCVMLGLVIDGVAPTFQGQRNSIQALKLAVYSYTPWWLAGVLCVIPLLGMLSIFAGPYAIYVLYLGIPRLMKTPHDKALPYTVVVIVAGIALTIILGVIGGFFVIPGSFSTTRS